MDEIYGPAAIAIYLGEIDTLTQVLTEDPSLATRVSSVSHPTLLQLVACDAAQIVDPVGATDVLVAHGAVMGGPLVAAAGCDSRSVVERLLEHGAPVDGDDPQWTPLDEALYWSQHDMAQLLLSKGAAIRALGTAAGLGDVAAVETFLGDNDVLLPEAGPVGSPFADTLVPELVNDAATIIDHAFVMAVNAGQQATAVRLLSAGARINAKPPGYHWKGTALHAATWRGDVALVQWLLDNGADPTIRDDMVSSDALGWARHHKHDQLVALLGGKQ